MIGTPTRSLATRGGSPTFDGPDSSWTFGVVRTLETHDPRGTHTGHGQSAEKRETSGGSSRRATKGEMKERASGRASQRPAGLGTRLALPATMAIALMAIRAPWTGKTGSPQGAALTHGPVVTTGDPTGTGAVDFAFSSLRLQQQVPPSRHPLHRQWCSEVEAESWRGDEMAEAETRPAPDAQKTSANAIGRNRWRVGRMRGYWGGDRTEVEPGCQFVAECLVDRTAIFGGWG
jgi:hypothetical protein